MAATQEVLTQIDQKMFSPRELQEMSKDQSMTLLTLINNNLKGGIDLNNPKEVASLKQRFLTKHSHPAIDRLRALMNNPKKF